MQRAKRVVDAAALPIIHEQSINAKDVITYFLPSVFYCKG
jgi:hypothetical protein